MPVKILFKCEFCGAEPDAPTRRALEAQLQELLFGTYLDADPGHWLVWHGSGLYGRNRYACGDHRGELKAEVREHYGCIGPHPWAMGPHTVKVLRRGRVAARKRVGPGWSSRPRWGPTT
jgi:hypothetical protein